MGGVLSLFSGGVDVSDVFIDFKNAEPGEQERDLCIEADAVLAKGSAVYDALNVYEDCGLAIRRALSNPTRENETEAFNAVRKNVDVIHQFHQYSGRVEALFPTLLSKLASENEKQTISEMQAISSRVALLLDFVMKLDELKMLRPGLQNDFSFYRRSLGKYASDTTLVVRDDAASVISLFIAQPIPMMTALAKATQSAVEAKSETAKHIPRVLATIANVCLNLVQSDAFRDDRATTMLCLRALVSSVVLYDHISPEGAFVKRSGINIRQACQLLVKSYPDEKALINALRYSTLHFSDDSTPSRITDLLQSA